MRAGVTLFPGHTFEKRNFALTDKQAKLAWLSEVEQCGQQCDACEWVDPVSPHRGRSDRQQCPAKAISNCVPDARRLRRWR
jgi:hypothetical protein